LSGVFSDTSFSIPDGLNFVYAAETVTPTVVHIKSSYSSGSGYFHNPLEEFFDMRPENPRGRRGLGYGSGVIISDDGYIVTNHHVIDNADLLEVTFFDGRKVKAKLVGQDPTTDLALIKISGKNLPYVRFGDSDKLKIGEWVLAIGNPYANGKSYDLTSTVTAGIISAKSRSIGILRDTLRVESFIQTDAAVNPGNSGGALVNLNGELVGINTAIASPTGSFSGYSFAIPVSIVKKVMNDLLEFGTVQRALLGVMISEINADVAQAQKILEYNGVFIEGVTPRGAADEAGIKANDVIISIDGKPVNTVPQLQELVAQKRPGDRINVEVLRQGHPRTIIAALKSAKGDDQALSTSSFKNE
jgi:serine protease Do